MIKFFDHHLEIPDVSHLINLDYKTYISGHNANLILQQNCDSLLKVFVSEICKIVNVESYRYIVSKCNGDIDWHIDKRNTAVNVNLIVDGEWKLMINNECIDMKKSQLYVLDTSIKHRVVGNGLFLFLSITPFSREYKYDF